MLKSKTVLIVEDDAYTALDLAATIEELGGTVAGPVATTTDALALVAMAPISAAIVDIDIPNVGMLTEMLDAAGVALVYQADSRLTALDVLPDPVATLYRPVAPAMVFAMLTTAIGKVEQPDSNS